MINTLLSLPLLFANEPARSFFIFLALLAGGEITLIPVLYAFDAGLLSLLPTALAFVSATIVADTLWYLAGRYIPLEKMRQFQSVQKREEYIRVFSRHFSDHAFKLLFISKFLFGTRSTVQFLCGLNAVSYTKYIAVGLSATLLWAGGIYTLIFILKTLIPIEDALIVFQISIALLLALLFTTHYWLTRYLWRKVLKQKMPEGDTKE